MTSKKRQIMKEFRLDEISIVDHPAQQGAKAVIAKRRELEKRMALTTQNDGHAHLVVQVTAGSEGLSEQKAGSTNYVDGHQHSWIMDDAGNITIADAEGHTHGLSVLVKSGDLTEEQLAGLELVHHEAGTTAEPIGKSGGTSMSNEIKKTAEHEAVEKELELEKAKVARLEKVAVLTDSERSYFKGLDETAQDEFLAKSDEDRAKVVEQELAKKADADPVVYQTEDGTEIRKSQDPTGLLVKQAKDLMEEKKKRKEMEEKAKKADLAKRASELTIPGEDDAKVALLKAIDSLPEDEQSKAMELLTANADRLAKATQRLGTTDGGFDTGSDLIDPIAKRLRTENPSWTPEQAYSKALQTPEGLAAYNKMRSM